MNLTNLINGEYSKYKKFEDRFNAILDIPNDYKINYESAIRLNKSIASLEHKYNHGSIKNIILDDNRKLNDSHYFDVVRHIDEIRYRGMNLNYLTRINVDKNNNSVNDIIGLIDSSNSNYPILSKKNYYLNDKLDFIHHKINSIGNSNLNLDDLDNLNYTLEKLNKNYYLRKKIKSDEGLAKKLAVVKKKVQHQINLTTALMYDRNISYQIPKNEIKNNAQDTNIKNSYKSQNGNETKVNETVNETKVNETKVNGTVNKKKRNWFNENIKLPLFSLYSDVKLNFDKYKTKIIGTVAFSALLLSGINSCNDINRNYYSKNNIKTHSKHEYEWSNPNYQPKFLNMDNDTFIYNGRK